MKKRIVIVDDDEKYISSLEMILLTKEEDLVELEVVTGEYFEEYFSQSHNIDCLIIDELYYTEMVWKHNIDFVFVLSYLQQEEVFNARLVEKIYKYSSVKEIFHKVIGKLGLPTDARNIALGEQLSNQPQVIMVYSPVGGVGKTSVSLALCYQLSMLNKNVLYINVDDIQNYQFYLNKEGFVENGFERVLYTKNENVLSAMQNTVWHMEFDCLKPFRGTKEAYGLEAHHFSYLLDKLKESGLYDFIIIDGDSSFGKFNGELMVKSDKILTVVNSSSNVDYTLRIFLSNIRISEKEKMLFVCNEYDQNMLSSVDYSVVEYLPKINFVETMYMECWYSAGLMKETALMLV